MACAALPSQEVLRQLLDYDPNTGKLVWKPRAGRPAFNKRWAGEEAFTTVERGYKQGRVFGRLVYAHRVVWKWVTGEDPDDIDHISGDRADNRFSNLRNVSRSVNMRNRRLSRNNSSGVHGVRLTVYGSWQAYIGHQGQSICLGSFRTLEDATAARVQARVSP